MISTIITYAIFILLIVVIIYLIRRAQRFSKYEQKENPNVIHLSEHNFDEITGKGLVLIEFWAEWCKPCKFQAPILNEIAEKEKGTIKVCKIDIDKEKSFIEKFDIQNIPSILIYHKGEMVQKLIGYKSRQAVKQALKKYH